MKYNNKIVFIITIIIMVFILSIAACSKSSKNKNDNSSEFSSNGSVHTQINDGDVNRIGNGRDDSSGIYVTVKNIINYESGTFSLSMKNNLDTPMNLAWASVYGVELEDDLEDGSLDIYLENYDGPWTKPGEYYIFLYETEQFGYYYTNGKSMVELGIEDYPKSDADYKKLPKYNLRTTGNIIDFQKQVLLIRKPQSYIEGRFLHGN